MPFKSEAQRAYLYLKHPEVAKKFESETPKGVDLPEHVLRKKAAMRKLLVTESKK